MNNVVGCTAQEYVGSLLLILALTLLVYPRVCMRLWAAFINTWSHVWFISLLLAEYIGTLLLLLWCMGPKLDLKSLENIHLGDGVLIAH